MRKTRNQNQASPQRTESLSHREECAVARGLASIPVLCSPKKGADDAKLPNAVAPANFTGSLSCHWSVFAHGVRQGVWQISAE